MVCSITLPLFGRGLRRNFGTRHLAFSEAELLVPRHEAGYVETINYKWSFCTPPGLTFRSSPFCQQSAFICFREDLRINSDYFPTQHCLIGFISCNIIIIIIIIITIRHQLGLDRPVFARVMTSPKVLKVVFGHFVCNGQSYTKIPPIICT